MGGIRFYALRRAEWKKHPLIKTIKLNVKNFIKNYKQNKKGVPLILALDH
jgi:hypothetical protein